MASLFLKRNLYCGLRLLGFKVDRSKFPKLVEHDLEEKFSKGSGPGGQSVNKTTNAVFLRHLPTGVWVKCHESRSLDNNRKLARKHLLSKLDNHLNGEDSVESQEKRIESWKRERKKEKTRLKYKEKQAEKTEQQSGGVNEEGNADQESTEANGENHSK